MIDAVAGERPHRLPVRRRVLPRRLPEPRGHVRPGAVSAGSATPSRTPAGWTRRSSGRAHLPVLRRPVRALLRRRLRRTSTRATRAASPRRCPASSVSTRCPRQFHDGLDAALAGADGTRVPVPGPAVRVHRRARTVAAADRRRRGAGCATCSSPIRTTHGIDAAFVARGRQPVRFQGRPVPALRDADGRARRRRLPAHRSRTTGGHLPPSFESGLDARVRLRGTTYFVRGDRTTSATPAATAAGSTARIPSRSRGAGARGPTTRWTDLRAIAALQAAAGPDLGLLGRPGRGPELDGRHGGPVLPGSPPCSAGTSTSSGGCSAIRRSCPPRPGSRTRSTWSSSRQPFELFELAATLGGPPSTVFADVWTPLYADDQPSRGPPTRCTASWPCGHSGPEWPALERRLQDELNVVKRDALVQAVLAQSSEPSHLPRPVRPLLHRRRHGQPGPRTSRVREAIAAAQLFFHRYLLDLQPVTLRPGDDGQPARPDAVKAELRRWWSWMKNYRLWEANRKVYLYPENYLRPELRDTKTPAFAALEDDLLQGEITQASAERAYRRYLDEYTEVSRLTIAGGYVHEPDGRRRAALAPGAVRADEDRPSPVLLPPRRVLPRGEPVGRLAPVAEGERPDRQRPGLPGLRLRPGVRVLGHGRGRRGHHADGLVQRLHGRRDATRSTGGGQTTRSCGSTTRSTTSTRSGSRRRC